MFWGPKFQKPHPTIQPGARTKRVVWYYHSGSSCSGAENNYPRCYFLLSVSIRALVSGFLLETALIRREMLPTADRIELRTLRISGKLVIELKHVRFEIDHEVKVHLILVNLVFLSLLRPGKPSGTVWPPVLTESGGIWQSSQLLPDRLRKLPPIY